MLVIILAVGYWFRTPCIVLSGYTSVLEEHKAFTFKAEVVPP